jgi:hypothetical protein
VLASATGTLVSGAGRGVNPGGTVGVWVGVMGTGVAGGVVVTSGNVLANCWRAACCCLLNEAIGADGDGVSRARMRVCAAMVAASADDGVGMQTLVGNHHTTVSAMCSAVVSRIQTL